MTPFSKLPSATKNDYLMRARMEIYTGTEPVDPEKEKQVKERAKKLYEAHCRFVTRDNVSMLGV